MRNFAHWKNTEVTHKLLPGPDGLRREEKETDQIGPGDETTIHFIVDIPEEVTRDKVVLKLRVRVNNETDGIGFEDEWPPEVRRVFDARGGNRLTWQTK
jgi:hypothetical protein